MASLAHSQSVTVAAAADLKFALDDCVKVFQATHAGWDIKVSYGSSGNFCSQLANGAPFDLFLSADKRYPDTLVAKGLADPATLFPYAWGRLVLWVPNGSPIAAKGLSALNDSAVKKLAIANPEHAPYGQAAVAALKSLGTYDDVKDKLVMGDNIAQTAQFVESGAADAGLIALSLATAPAMASKGTFTEIPLDSYPKMIQAGIIMKNAANPAAAKAFADFLTSDAGRSVLKKFGFTIPN